MVDLSGLIIGRYHLIEKLGEGGMAVVYKALDTRLETEVAVKVIRTERLIEETKDRALIRFEREAKALARLTHPNIVKVMDYGNHDGKPYLVMPYLPGGTLKQKMGKPIPWQEAIQLLLPIAEALDYAHSQNMIHRDVKPANILLTQRGQPMLTDFGIAKVLDLEETLDLTGTSATVGTPEYMAPEQATAKSVDKRVDIYSLGVVLYEMVTGRKPFIADTPMAVLIKHATESFLRPKQLVPTLPDGVERVLLKALAKQPENRYQSSEEMVKAFESLLGGMGKIIIGENLFPREKVQKIPAQKKTFHLRSITVAIILVGVMIPLVITSPVFKGKMAFTDITTATLTFIVTPTLLPEYTQTPVQQTPVQVENLSPTPTVEVDPFILQDGQVSKPGETILFLEDFQDGQESFYSLDGDWSIQEDSFEAGNKVIQLDTTGTSAVSTARLVRPMPSSYIFGLSVRFVGDNLAGRDFVSIGWRENLNLVLYPSQGTFYARNRATSETFFSQNFDYTKNSWYKLRIESLGNSADFFLNDQLVGTVDNLGSAVLSPEVYFVVGEGSKIVEFDNLFVISPAD